MGMTAPRQGRRRAVATPDATTFPAMQRRVPTASAAGAFIGFVVSLTPSLAPRSWLVQGIVSGLTAALEYALATLTCPLRRRRRPRGWPPWRRWLVLAAGGAAAAALLWLSLRWQQQLHLTMGVERPAVASFSLGVPIVAATLLASAVTIARGAAALACTVAARVERKVPAGLAALAETLLIALGLVAAQNLLARGLLGVTDRSFATLDDALTAELPPPRSPRVSGGPGSLVSWDSLGVQGRTFVSRVTPVAELEAFARSEALEPVRVYAGVSTAADDAERARLVVAEPDGPWEPPRVAYFQHASDPVVWWSPRLAVQPPDWLEEPRGPDVLDEVRWIPLVTFLQLSADLATANALPAGHGHNYGSEIVAGLAALQPPDGWSDEDTRRLRQALEERYPAR